MSDAPRPGPVGLLTRRGWGLLLAAAVLWAVGRVFGTPALHVAAVTALAAVVLAVVAVAVTSTGLTADRRVRPDVVAHGGTATVTLRLRAGGRLPTPAALVEDAVAEGLAGDAAGMVGPLRPGRSHELRYRVTGARRGLHEVGPAQVLVRDPFGLAARRRATGDVDELVVLPRVTDLPAGLPLAGAQGEVRGGRPERTSAGLELAGVRAYVRGDDMRRVHWRSTAHRGELMVREDEDPSRPHAALVLDTAADRLADRVFEQAVEAAASIGAHVAGRGLACTLLDRPPRRDVRPLGRDGLLDRLARSRPDPDADLLGCWRSLASSDLAAGTLLAVVGPPDEQLLRAMVRAGRGASVRAAVVVHDGGGTRRAEALRRAGWRATAVGPDDDLAGAWRTLLRSAPARASV